MKINARLGRVTVVNGSIVLHVDTHYGTLEVPVRAFNIEDIDNEGLFEPFEIELHLPKWIVK